MYRLQRWTIISVTDVFLKELKTKLERNKDQVKQSFAKKMADASKVKGGGYQATLTQLDNQLIEQLNILQKTFENSVSLLVSAYEKYAFL